MHTTTARFNAARIGKATAELASCRDVMFFKVKVNRFDALNESNKFVVCIVSYTVTDHRLNDVCLLQKKMAATLKANIRKLNTLALVNIFYDHTWKNIYKLKVSLFVY